MRLLGFLLMISGWLLTLAALVLLRSVGQRLGFVLAGLAVESLGLGLVTQGYRALRSRQG